LQKRDMLLPTFDFIKIIQFFFQKYKKTNTRRKPRRLPKLVVKNQDDK